MLYNCVGMQEYINYYLIANNDRGSFDQKSVDQNCVLSVDQNFHNQLTEIFDTFQLIECTVG